jgi:hypothetical protein
MKDKDKIPVYYQNSEISDNHRPSGFEKLTYVNMPFYQTECFSAGILYKPISKIYKFENGQ